MLSNLGTYISSARLTNLAPATLRVLPFAVLAAAGFSAPVNAEEYFKSYSVSGRPDVHVDVDDSSVHVMTSDTAQVEFRVTYEGTAAFKLGGKLHVDSQQNGNRVELTARLSPGVTLGFNNMRINTEVRMPRNADLQLETRDGGVEVSSLNGKITVHTADGAIKASQLSGTIDLHTRDGGIKADTLTGELKLNSDDGAIGAVNLDGKSEVSSKDGSIRIAGRFDALDIKSGDGGVVARVSRGSRMSSAWNVRTGDGSVELDLPTDFQANLDASTRDGHITVDVPVTVQGSVGKSQVRGTMNGGGPALVIHTGDGSIRLKGI